MLPLCLMATPTQVLLHSLPASSLLLFPTRVQPNRILYAQEEVLLVLLHLLQCNLMLLDLMLSSLE